MRKIVITMVATTLINVCLFAQSSASSNYKETRNAPAMKWTCPEIEKYQSLLHSLRNEDYKIYADNVKDNIELVTFKDSPSDKFQVTQAILNI